MIKWVEDFGEYPDEHVWLGYIGNDIIVAEINNSHELFFTLSPIHIQSYSSVKVAKRGAERLLGKWLKNAGLVKEVSHD